MSALLHKFHMCVEALPPDVGEADLSHPLAVFLGDPVGCVGEDEDAWEIFDGPLNTLLQQPPVYSRITGLIVHPVPTVHQLRPQPPWHHKPEGRNKIKMTQAHCQTQQPEQATPRCQQLEQHQNRSKGGMQMGVKRCR
ncbi:hypothetical protein L208DRAFT_1395682 [Tricholoma matsutake]|nr:hypothetical protein L208DRAFT_1395682 [Tricholoma matsutake 945]